MQNIEHIAKGNLYSKTGESYRDFRKKLSPKYSIVWRDLLLGYALIILSMTGAIYSEQALNGSYLILCLVILFWGLLIGFCFAYVQLFIHEAAHFNIHPNRKTNDRLANVLICVLVGTEIESYRKTHWKHHQRLGHTDDSEHSYFNGLTFSFLVKMLTGIHAIQVYLNRGEGASEAPKNYRPLLFGVLLHLCLLLFLVYNQFYFSAIAWVIGIGVFFPFFGSLRQLLEHRDDLANDETDYAKMDHGNVSRLFKKNIFSSFFGGAGFNKHMLHHWDPSVSYTRMEELEGYLRNTDEAGPIIEKATTTYWSTFVKLLKN